MDTASGVGEDVGRGVRGRVGSFVGCFVGHSLGNSLGISVDSNFGASVGFVVGFLVGFLIGDNDGEEDGLFIGNSELPVMLVSARAGVCFNNVRREQPLGGVLELQKELASIVPVPRFHSKQKSN